MKITKILRPIMLQKISDILQCDEGMTADDIGTEAHISGEGFTAKQITNLLKGCPDFYRERHGRKYLWFVKK